MNSYIADVQRSILPTNCVSEIRDVFNDAVEIPMQERDAWLIQHVVDPDEREAIATLLLAYDGDGSIEVEAA